MELAFNADEQAFQREVREFINRALPRDLAERVRGALYFDRRDCSAWQKILYRRGWAAPGWPSEFGGPGWTPTQRYIFEQECAAASAPELMPMGVTMVGPVIYTFGTPAQRARF
ncbi:MAG: acyl-CoA dehydrogenase family protein, partial [Pseudomonadota bacterium]